MKRAILSFCLLLAAYCLPAQSMTPKDTQFITDAFQDGQLEIKVGELTITKAKSDSVRRVGRQLIIDHTKANDELKTLAVTKHVVLPDSLGEECKAHYNKLAQLSGEDFDKAFVQLVVPCHKKAIEKFKNEADTGSDADVRAWAAVTLPVLRHHLMIAQDLDVDLSKK